MTLSVTVLVLLSVDNYLRTLDGNLLKWADQLISASVIDIGSLSLPSFVHDLVTKNILYSHVSLILLQRKLLIVLVFVERQ